jgi:hypothetical protein
MIWQATFPATAQFCPGSNSECSDARAAIGRSKVQNGSTAGARLDVCNWSKANVGRASGMGRKQTFAGPKVEPLRTPLTADFRCPLAPS